MRCGVLNKGPTKAETNERNCVRLQSSQRAKLILKIILGKRCLMAATAVIPSFYFSSVYVAVVMLMVSYHRDNAVAGKKANIFLNLDDSFSSINIFERKYASIQILKKLRNEGLINDIL